MTAPAASAGGSVCLNWRSPEVIALSKCTTTLVPSPCSSPATMTPSPNAVEFWMQRLRRHLGRGGDDIGILPDDLDVATASRPSGAPRPCVWTRRCGDATRIRSRRSLRRPFITPSTTISAVTPRVMLPMAMMVCSDALRVPRWPRRYRIAIRRSSGVGHHRVTARRPRRSPAGGRSRDASPERG